MDILAIVLIVKLSLLLSAAALVGFLLATVIDQFLFAGLAEQAVNLASLLLISAFCLLMSAGLIQIGWLILASVFDYFSCLQRCEREQLCYLNQYNRINRLFWLKKDRIDYDYQQQRKRLLWQNNRKSAET
ncbi:hypothetical protein MCAMS1_00720 [biofilm metagenome]